MADRGSFVTEHMYCASCGKGVLRALRSEFKTVVIASGDEDYPQIIAGSITSTHRGGEVLDFSTNYEGEIAKVICHEIRVAVIGEVGQHIFTIYPV